MADTAWSSEEPIAPKKTSIPTWVWFCGGGCLLAVLVAIVGVALAIPMIAKARDPKVQWERLAHILPYDEQPPELTPKMGFGFSLGASMEQVQLEDSRGFMITIQSQTGPKAAEGRRKMFASDKPEFPKDVGVMQFEDVQSASVEVQGRSLSACAAHSQSRGAVPYARRPASAGLGVGPVPLPGLP